ncbi:SymE family type I addiction module toxin [Chania multitudinisentens]|uniref:SymE family type I addiction module toxin n=1 Tax=Chania multitudinisentens TaxID=1639108 RepID=UPI001F41F0B3|nr:SymE family type I addiction module toxin [Chania multitudinisentens]
MATFIPIGCPTTMPEINPQLSIKLLEQHGFLTGQPVAVNIEQGRLIIQVGESL